MKKKLFIGVIIAMMISCVVACGARAEAPKEEAAAVEER